MKLNMKWVHRLLVVCISFKFTGLSTSTIRNVTDPSQFINVRTKRLDTEYVDSRDGYTSDAVSNDMSKRSINTDLDDDIGADDLMTTALYDKSPDDDTTEPDGNNEKRSSLKCQNDTMKCPVLRRSLEIPAIDFSIGNETPITMEGNNELTAEGKVPEGIFDGQASDNIMIQNETPIAKERVSRLTANASFPEDIFDESSNIMIQDEPPPVAMNYENVLIANASSPEDIVDELSRTRTEYSTIPSVDNTMEPSGVSREKRDSIITENMDYTFVSPEIAAMIRNNKNDKQESEPFDFDPFEDLMKTSDQSTASINAQQVIHHADAPVTDMHISTLTAKASSPKKEMHVEVNYNTLKRELMAEAEMMKNVSHIKRHKHSHSHSHKKHWHSHKKHIKSTSSKYDQISQRLPPIANQKRNELSAKSSHKSSKAFKRSKTDSTNGELRTIFTEMRSAKHKLTRNDIRKLAKTAVMLAALKSQVHFEPVPAEKRHTISKPKHNKTAKKKKSTKSKKKTTKKSKTHTTRKVDKSEGMNAVRSDTSSDQMSFNSNDQSNQPEFSVNHNLDREAINTAKHEKVAKQLDITVEQPTNGRTEFSEDISKKGKNVGVSDDAMTNLVAKSEGRKRTTTTTVPTTPKPNPLIDSISETGTTTIISVTTTMEPTTVSSESNILPTTITTTIDGAADLSKELALKVITDGDIISKKSEVTRPDDDIDKAISDYDTNDLLNMIDVSGNDKRNVVPTREVSDSMATLKSVLSKVSPNKVPGNFLPDIPAGLRMIAWKKLLEKKRSQLAEYESAVGADAVVDKQVIVNIGLDSQKPSDDTPFAKLGSDEKDTIAKKAAADQSDQIKDLVNEETNSFMTVGGHDDNLETARHVHYLKKHIQGARSLRKLIAKTLVGHCHSTGRRILAAFIAMDKALERAQAIATVIGGKFNVDPSKIENLVSDKEDQVVETFLRDIFTKL